MVKNTDKSQTNWLIPIEVKEDFTTFCNKSGTIAQDDCAGALVIWQYLPAQIRERAKLEAKGIQAIDKDFWAEFRKVLDFSLAIGQRGKQPQKKSKK